MSLPRVLRSLPWLAAVVLVAGCASSDSKASGAAFEQGDAWIAVESGQGGATAADAAPVADGEGGLFTDGTPDAGSGQRTPGGDGGTATAQPAESGSIGLVLPGAQNVAGFRAKVAAGQVPQAEDFPMEGWFNEVGSPLPPADPAHSVDLHVLAALVAEPEQSPDVFLQFGFNTAKTLQELQPPVALLVLVDASGSVPPQQLTAIRQGILSAADNLPAGSWLGVTAFAAAAQTVWAAPWNAADRPKLVAALSKTQQGGGTDLFVALQAAAEQLGQSGPKAIAQQRVILCSDGGATVGGHTATQTIALAKTLGLKVSAVGTGPQPRTGLLAALAAATAGTYYDAPTPQATVAALTGDLATLLVPVAEDLKITVNLAPGWKLLDAFALPYASSGDQLFLGADSNGTTGSADASQATIDAAGSAPDLAAADASTKTNTAKLAGVLFPSQRNGMAVLRLQMPPGKVADQAFAMQLAAVQWQYRLTASGLVQQHDTKVEIKGLSAIPDGGFEYYAHPIARRTAALVRLGEAMRGACGTVQQGQDKAAALLVLSGATEFAQRMQAQLGVADDPQGNVADGVALAGALAKNIGALP